MEGEIDMPALEDMADEGGDNDEDSEDGSAAESDEEEEDATQKKKKGTKITLTDKGKEVAKLAAENGPSRIATGLLSLSDIYSVILVCQ